MRRLAAVLFLGLASPALACGPDSDCPVGARSYRLHLPPAATDGPVGALVFAHGYKGSAAAEMRNAGLRKLADELGLALIALKSAGDDWEIAHTPESPARTEALEYAYVEAVLADAATRARIDPARRVMAGFSAGGMMTWTQACGDSGLFRGFVALSGTFWAPVPPGCTAPAANLVHIHGTTDTTVPLSGRAIGETRQGDVGQALAMYAAHGGFTGAAESRAPGNLTCRTARNTGGKLLQFCIFEGGHAFNTDRLRHGIEAVLAAP